MTIRRYLIPVLVLSLGLTLSCGGEKRAAKEESAAAPVVVQTTAAGTAEWPAVYEATGTVRARTASTLSSKVMGYVRDVRFQAGDHVRSGQLLVVLEAKDLDAQRAQAEAAVREARGALPEVSSAVAAAQANLDLANKTFARMKDLFEKKSISNQEFDEASARLKVARAGHAMALAKREQLGAKVRQAEEAHRAAGVVLSYAEIKAPFAGTVTDKKVEPGVLAAPGMPLATIEQAGVYRLEAQVEESRLANVRVGQPVSVALDSLDKTLAARVSEIVPAVDAASRTFVVKIDLPGVPQLRSGLFGRARFPLGSRKVLAIPATALVERGQVQSVYVVEDGRARNRIVTTGAREGGQLEVLSGLSASEKIVHPVPPSLVDDARVEVRP
ncbi:MAG: efflux RND transporter periplasmic adaptor subunit [Acidobacteriales bacterium]|nr:efflux RND transporter periplasmic adaptor subunit [Terriglobales bacterium]